MSMAAAAAVMASGLFVGGSSASLAFAEPDTSAAGDGPGTGTGGTSNTTPGQSADPQPESPAPGFPDSGPPTAGGPSSGSQQPQSHVGNGRTGLPAGSAGATPDSTPPSKQPESPGEQGPQTPAANPGELPLTPAEVPVDPAAGEQPPVVDEEGGSGAGGGSGPPTADGAADPALTAPAETVPVVTEPTEPAGPGEETLLPEADPTALKEGEVEEEPQVPDWCWWPLPTFPTLPSGDGGNGAVPQTTQLNFGELLNIPPMQLPQLQVPQFPEIQLPLLPPDLLNQLAQPVQPFIDAVTGLATAASELPFTTITLPVIVTPGGTAGGGGGGGGGGGAGAGGAGTTGIGPRPGMPEAPRVTGKPGGKPASPPEPVQTSPDVPAFTAGAGAAPAPSYRAGYTDYLRAAGLGEVAAVAVPGVTGILALVGAGGLLGYRQARAGHTVRASGTGRFMS